MRLTNITEVEDFKTAVNSCKGDVWLQAPDGSEFNLKSLFSQYIALGALLGENGDNLELFCALREDENNFLRFFNKYPEVL